METRIGNWGGNFAVRLPRAAVKQLGLHRGETLQVSLQEGSIVLRRETKHYDLDELISEMRKQKAPSLEWNRMEPLSSEWTHE